VPQRLARRRRPRPDDRPAARPGHEFAGVVHEVGSEVAGWRRGSASRRPSSTPAAAAGPAGRRPAGVRASAPARVHALGVVRRAGRRRASPTSTSSPCGRGRAVAAAALGCRFATAFRAVAQVGRVAAGSGSPCTAAAGRALRRPRRGRGRRPGRRGRRPRRGARARHGVGAEAAVRTEPGQDPMAVAAAVRAAADGPVALSARRARQPATCAASLACLAPRGGTCRSACCPRCSAGPRHRCTW
jgi:alcohol dehydrogenase